MSKKKSKRKKKAEAPEITPEQPKDPFEVIDKNFQVFNANFQEQQKINLSVNQNIEKLNENINVIASRLERMSNPMPQAPNPGGQKTGKKGGALSNIKLTGGGGSVLGIIESVLNIVLKAVGDENTPPKGFEAQHKKLMKSSYDTMIEMNSLRLEEQKAKIKNLERGEGWGLS